jgi:hypothetical protein
VSDWQDRALAAEARAERAAAALREIAGDRREIRHEHTMGYWETTSDAMARLAREALVELEAGDRQEPEPPHPEAGSGTAARESGHECPWCPLEPRDLFALAANYVNAHGTSRAGKKLAALQRGVAHYQAALDAHFEAIKRG